MALAGDSAAQGSVAEALFRGHFQDGRDISDTDFLVSVGRGAAGLAEGRVRASLVSERTARQVDDDVWHATVVEEVKAVPCVTVLGRWRVGGYQEAEVFENLFNKIRVEDGL